MADLQIFATDPDAKPAPRKEFVPTEYAYVFRSGAAVWNEKKKKTEGVSLANWRVLTGNPSVADGIAELFGGKPTEWDATKEENLEVMTEVPSVDVVINGSAAITERMILWGPRGPIHECDGVSFLSPADLKGTPCGCPPLLSARKELAKQGRGPNPAITIEFHLAGLGYELGLGKFLSQGWSLANVIHEVKNDLDAVDGEALCRMELELVEYTNKANIAVSFRKPVITVLGSYNDAIAEAR